MVECRLLLRTLSSISTINTCSFGCVRWHTHVQHPEAGQMSNETPSTIARAIMTEYTKPSVWLQSFFFSLSHLCKLLQGPLLFLFFFPPVLYRFINILYFQFYGRDLPAFLVDFRTDEGRKRLVRTLGEGTAAPYLALASTFHTQSEPAYCGLATLAIVLNALQVWRR